jgi:hypothetical protein
MPAEKSLLQRELDDSSSNNDDILIFSAAAIVETFSNKKEDMVVPSQGTMLFIEIEKAGTKGCFKITRLMSRHTAQIYFAGGSCAFTCDTYIVRKVHIV